jgi:hypothetical protein
MAVSPLLFQSEDSSRRIVTSKSLAVRPISHGVAEQQSSGSTEPVPELAEKLNEELKQKYVKGLVPTARALVDADTDVAQTERLARVLLPWSIWDI